jgi:hypothetical protein
MEADFSPFTLEVSSQILGAPISYRRIETPPLSHDTIPSTLHADPSTPTRRYDNLPDPVDELRNGDLRYPRASYAQKISLQKLELLTPPLTPPDSSTASSCDSESTVAAAVDENTGQRWIDQSGSWKATIYPSLMREHARLQ